MTVLAGFALGSLLACFAVTREAAGFWTGAAASAGLSASLAALALIPAWRIIAADMTAGKD